MGLEDRGFLTMDDNFFDSARQADSPVGQA